MYDLIIIGGGPAGVAAGIYAARKKIKTILITDSFGGQSITSDDIQNWIGVKSISGFDLAKSLEEHLRAQEDIEIMDSDLVETIRKNTPSTSSFNNFQDKSGQAPSTNSGQAPGFSVKTKKGAAMETKYILITSGSRRRKLSIPGEKEFDGKGVAYCATCDAPLFKDKTVAVVGGGNAGLEAAVDLFPYASQIYLLARGEALKGDLITQEKIKANPNVQIIVRAESQEVLGDKFVTGLKYKDTGSGEIKELKLDGVFVEIGSVPNSDFAKDLVNLNQAGEIVVDPKTQRTSNPGIWAAGDVCDVLYKQNNISVGDAVKAVLNIYETLHKNNK